MNKVTKYMKVKDMSIGTTIIVVGDMQVELDFSEIGTTDHGDQFSATHASMKVIDMQTVHKKNRPISNFLQVVVLAITL